MPETIQRSFAGGEISPSLRSRADITKYQTGLALCENMFIRAQGGAYSRAGLRFIGEIGDSSKEARLIPFSFNTEQTYVLVFEENTLRFVRDGGYVLENDAVTIYEIATPYTEDELPRIGFTQRADVMTLVHPNHAPRNLSRTGDNAWSLDVIDFTPRIDPPTFVTVSFSAINNITQADPAVVTTTTPHGFISGQSVSIDGVLGMTELNGNAYIITILTSNTFSLNGIDSTAFTAYTSGGTARQAPLALRGTGAGDFDKTYTYVVTAVSFTGEESIASQQRSTTTKSLSDTAGVRLQWNAVAGANFYKIYKDPSNSTGVFGLIGTSNTLTFDDFNIAPITSEAPPKLRDPFTELTGSISDFDVNDLTVTTTTAHNLGSGELVTIDGILQPVNFNGGTFSIIVLDDVRFQLVDTGIVGPFPAYTSGGTFLRVAELPAVVNYYQQRQIFANTNFNRQTVFTSQTANFDSLRTSTPTRADDAITFSIAGREVNEIRHIVELDAMILLTSGGTWRVTEGQDRVLTPSTIGVRKQSSKGASWVQPQILDNTVIYIQDQGSRVRDLSYDFSNDNFGGEDLSIMAQHLFEDFEIKYMTHADEPYGILWMVRNDGRLLGLTYQREQQVWAWHQHVTDGTFESITSIQEDGRDAVYTVVNRTIGGVTKRYIERMEKRHTATDDVFCVDSGLNYDGAPADNISGLDHLEGKDVAVVADGNVVSGLTVSGGAITLPRNASKVTVGLPYTCSIETLDVDTGELAATLKAKSISISKVVIEFLESRGAKCGPIQDNDTVQLEEFKPRLESDNYDAIAVRTEKAEVILEPTWNRGGGLRIVQTYPLPMTILAVVPQVDIS